MEWVETIGKTLDEAKDKALDQLGVDAQEAEFEILDEPTKGLFGRMRGDARIRARVAPRTPRPKHDRRNRRKRESGDGPGNERGNGQRSSAPRSGKATRTRATNPQPAGASKVEATSDAGTAPQRETTKPASTRGNTAAKTSEEEAVTVSAREQAEIMREFLEGLVDAFGFDASIEQRDVDEETVELAVTGGELGLLIGPKGQTLSCVQDLARTVLQRRATGTYEGRVRIDIAGYRERRREALTRFTEQMVAKVLEEGTSKALEPMHPADRKLVHDVANAIDGVHTVSEGEDRQRRVVILPGNA